ncbi:MAG: DNA-protecting protein DprA [Acidimicrobiaceae bacterium]|nr:DNA-processing protein DprA [Ilumatobacter sp.]MCB9382246.1 DNA-protecting protein DprA [Acidimicrobiaceae bacterium]MCO5329456.1 DNA-processing protein DprA [Ilumatobacteraceae bacterium]
MSAGCPPEAYAAALAGFEGMTLSRLAALLRHHDPEQAWAVALRQQPATGLIAHVLAKREVRDAWQRSAAARRPDEVFARCQELAVQVLLPSSPRFPGLLAADRQPPPVLFAKGDLSVLEGRRVAVVGTRNATAAGREAARQLGAGLATAGVHVVSGLARGVDGVVHRALLAAEGEGRPVGVVACGLDVVYPREHRDLWAAVANCGLLLSEMPPGIGPEAFRFPLRNRIIAALAEVVVVVESRERGGSLITAAEALDRSIPVMAVPGPPTNRAAAGTNSLLRDGAAPVLDAGDVLASLALEPERAAFEMAELRARPRAEDHAVYEVLRHEPRTIDGVALAAGLSLVDAAMALARLEQAGWVGGADGWFECVGSPLR